ncbi:MAG: DNA adenine methylase [Bacteroidales bacterium]|nr:DNA adenine methylase [Bacteroidales bacterium]
MIKHTEETASLEPIIKWPGGKERELKYIIPNLPESFDNYYEPFVGGGSVFMGISAKQYYINDFSTELMGLYGFIKTQNPSFFKYCESTNKSIDNAGLFAVAQFKTINELYKSFRADTINIDTFIDNISKFIIDNQNDVLSIIDTMDIDKSFFVNEMKTTFVRKMQRMKQLELTKGMMPEKDVFDNIETIIKGALYMYYRYLYNSDYELSQEWRITLFYYLRNYAYSGMFRYNSNGEFNVPYGGIAYNGKLTRKKLNYYQSDNCQDKLSKTTIDNIDFEAFLSKYQPRETDFVFLDPPYDTEFSTYAQNVFTRTDQSRLANYMIKKCKAKWMLIIKNTDFIYDLYSNRSGIYIKSFDKEYVVSFMNRNNKKVTHLLITNYV